MAHNRANFNASQQLKRKIFVQTHRIFANICLKEVPGMHEIKRQSLLLMATHLIRELLSFSCSAYELQYGEARVNTKHGIIQAFEAFKSTCEMCTQLIDKISTL